MAGRAERTRNRGRQWLAAAGCLAAASLVVTGCGNGSASSGATNGATVGLITKTETNPYFVKMKEGAQQAAQSDGVQLMTAAGAYDGDNGGQVTAVQNMVAAGVKGILITPNDPKAIAPTLTKARQQGVVVIALDTPPDPKTSADALFATNNLDAGVLIGKFAQAKQAGKPAQIAMLDLEPGVSVGLDRHNGFLQGYGIKEGDPQLACAQYTSGDQAKGQTAMENCLQKAPDINLVYTINEPAALGAYAALKAAGKEKTTTIVTIDGSCKGIAAVKSGEIAADSQQYPLKMAVDGLHAIVDYAKSGKKPSGFTDTGVNLITAQGGADAKDTSFGQSNCWG